MGLIVAAVVIWHLAGLFILVAAFVMHLRNLTFDDWLEHSFGREHDWWDPRPVEAVSYLTRPFENPKPALQGFADSQIAQGLTYLVNTSASGDNRWLCSTDVSIKDRVRCVKSVAALFAKIVRAAAHSRFVLLERSRCRDTKRCLLYVVGCVSEFGSCRRS